MTAFYLTGLATGSFLTAIGFVLLSLFGIQTLLYVGAIVGAVIFCAVFLLNGGGVLDRPMSADWRAPLDRRDG